MAKASERRLGKWVFRRRIGRGGQARVFEATSGEASDVVAIKPISTRGTKKAARFRQEVEQHVKLSSNGAPNIIPVIDHHIAVHEDGSIDGYIVMPRAYASLEDVAATFERRLELSLETFLGIVRGVEAAHGAGVIHRDLKPANVLFLDPSLREPLVADFGICLVKDARSQDRLTDVGETVGARFYMAPEQERGGVVDVTEAADIYALGKLLYFMLTGRNLYREELEEAFTEDDIAHDSRLEMIADEVLARTIVRDPVQRIQTAPELRSLIERLLTRFRGGPTCDGSSFSGWEIRDEATAPDRGQISVAGADQNRGAAAGEEIYHATVREILTGNPRILGVRFDQAKLRFGSSWTSLRKQLDTSHESLTNGVLALLEDQTDITFTLLATARCDADAVFAEIRPYLEYLINSTEDFAGDRRIRSVAHMAAAFQYMTASVAAVARNAWRLLSHLLNMEVEWYYQSDRPLYSHALDLSYFFHPEALERKATLAHDFYRSILNASRLGRYLGLRDDDLTTQYVQAQFLMSIKAAQLNEQGGEGNSFAYFGRFYGERLRPLLGRMEHDAAVANGVTAAFGETPEEWFSRLPGRLIFVRRNFWDPARYDWASLTNWPEE